MKHGDDKRVMESLIKSAVVSANFDIAKVRAQLSMLQRDRYQLHASLTTMIAAHAVLHTQRKAVKELFHEGMLEKSEADQIAGEIDSKLKRLQRNPPMIELPSTESLLFHVPWLQMLPQERLKQLLMSVESVPIASGEELLVHNRLVDHVYIVQRGTLLAFYLQPGTGKELVDTIFMGGWTPLHPVLA